MKDLDRLLNPNKRFLEYQDYLIDLIASSYHKSFKDLIATRIKDAIYFFDSTPDVTYETIKKLDSSLDNLKYYKSLMDDYMSKGEKLQDEIDDYTLRYLKELLNISDDVFDKNKEVILGLRFDAFDKRYKKYLTYDNEEKDLLLELQQDYIDTCKMIGIIPLLDEEKLDDCIQFLNRQEKVLEHNVIKHTIFGKNILDRLDNIKDVAFYKKVIIARELIYFEDDFDYDVNAITTFYKISENYSKTYISFPLLKKYLNKDLDIILLHELVHVSEISNKMCSIVTSEDYRVFNEFRTQEKARSLFERLRKDNVYIFDQDGNDDTLYKSAYDFYLPLVNPLLGTYRELFDSSAINNRLSVINENLGKDNFTNYCIFLTSLYENGLNMHGQSFDGDTISKNNDFINKMKTYSK